jgi:hypothetical protein
MLSDLLTLTKQHIITSLVFKLGPSSQLAGYRVTKLSVLQLIDRKLLTFFFSPQITELCGGSRVSHLGRRQFYSALKLIAAFQAGLPLRPELFHSSLDVPLPLFSWTASIGKMNLWNVFLLGLMNNNLFDYLYSL